MGFLKKFLKTKDISDKLWFFWVKLSFEKQTLYLPIYVFYKGLEQRPHVFTCLMSSKKRLLAATFLRLTVYLQKLKLILSNYGNYPQRLKSYFSFFFSRGSSHSVFFAHQFPYSNEDAEVFSIILFFTIRLWMFPFEFL